MTFGSPFPTKSFSDSFLTGFAVICSLLHQLKKTKAMNCEKENFMGEKKQ